MIFIHQTSTVKTIQTIQKILSSLLHKREKCAKTSHVRSLDRGMFSPFASFHRILDSDTTVHYFFFPYRLQTKLNKELPVTFRICVCQKALISFQKGLCGVVTENKTVVINTRRCSGPYKDPATLSFWISSAL